MDRGRGLGGDGARDAIMAGSRQRACGRVDKSCIRTIHGCAQGARIGIGEIDAVEIGASINEGGSAGDDHRAGVGNVDRAAGRACAERGEGEGAGDGGDRAGAGGSGQRADGLGIGSARVAQDTARRLRQRVRTEDDRAGVGQQVDGGGIGQFQGAGADSSRTREKIAGGRREYPCTRADLQEAGGVRGYGRGDRVVRGAGSSQDERFGAGDRRDSTTDRKRTGTAGIKVRVDRGGIDGDRLG